MSLCDPPTPVGKRMEWGNLLKPPEPSNLTQRAGKERELVLNKVHGKDQHLWLCSDLYLIMSWHACMCIHTCSNKPTCMCTQSMKIKITKKQCLMSQSRKIWEARTLREIWTGKPGLVCFGYGREQRLLVIEQWDSSSAKSLTAFCLCPRILPEDKFKSNELIHSMGES